MHYNLQVQFKIIVMFFWQKTSSSPMNIQEQFNLIAKEYDENRKKFIPCFEDYYVSATDFAAKSLEKKPELIFDLGSGTGLLASFWYPHFPDANYVLSDIAGEMLYVLMDFFLISLQRKKIICSLPNDFLGDFLLTAIASIVTMCPLISKSSRSSGIAVISFDFSSVLTCPKQIPSELAKAEMT